MRAFFAALFLLSCVWPALAVQPDEVLADPALEARARDISAELRCMVCQNQSIDDSDAPLARDLRILVRERIKAGDTNTQIKDFLVARYGEFVLLQPRLTAQTMLLWTSPVIVFLLALAAAAALWRRRTPRPGAQVSLSAEERARVEALLKSEDES